MFHFLAFLLLLFRLTVGANFGCQNATTSDRCGQLTGCSWTSSSCGGTFTPQSGIFVDSLNVNEADIQDGSFTLPFQSLDRALDLKISPIFILSGWSSVALRDSHSVSSSLLVRSIFTDQQWQLSISVDSSQSTIVSVTTSFEIRNADIFVDCLSGFCPTTVSIFKLNAGATLLLTKTSWKKCLFPSVLLVNALGTGIVKWSDAFMQNCNASFELGGTTMTISNVTIILSSALQPSSQSVFSSSQGNPTFSATALFVNSSSGLVEGSMAPLILFPSNASVTIQSSSFTNLQGPVMKALKSIRLIILTSTFSNITSDSTILEVSGASTNYNALGHNFRSSVFTNITVRRSIILLQRDSIKLTLFNISIDGVQSSLSNISATETTVEDLQYSSEWPGGLCLLARDSVSLTLTSSTFRNIQGPCFALKETALAITSCVFNNSAIESTSDLVAITGSSSSSWISVQTGTTSVSPYGIIRIASSSFIGSAWQSDYGGALRFTGIFTLSVQISDSNFSLLKADYGGGIYSGNSLLVLQVTNTRFWRNSARQGGAIFQVSDPELYVTVAVGLSITSSFLVLNSASVAGGAIYLSRATADIQASIFDQNTARDGGAVYLKNSTTQICLSNFTGNNASNSGGALRVMGRLNMTCSNLFEGNVDLLGNDIQEGTPQSFLISKPEKNISVKSGHSFNGSITVTVLDDLQDVAWYVNDEFVQLYTNDSAPTLLDSPIRQGFLNGTFTIASNVMVFIGPPLTVGYLWLSTVKDTLAQLSDAGLYLDTGIRIQLSDCDIGDVYDPTTTYCNTCLEGTYSLQDPYSASACLDCISERSTCPGGSVILPKPGYWRYFSLDDTLLACPKPEACLGGILHSATSETGFCAYPYEGNLCRQCATHHANFGSSPTCVDCTADGTYYLKVVAFILLQIAVILLSLRSSLNKIRETKDVAREQQRALTESMSPRSSGSNRSERYHQTEHPRKEETVTPMSFPKLQVLGTLEDDEEGSSKDPVMTPTKYLRHLWSGNSGKSNANVSHGEPHSPGLFKLERLPSSIVPGNEGVSPPKIEDSETPDLMSASGFGLPAGSGLGARRGHTFFLPHSIRDPPAIQSESDYDSLSITLPYPQRLSQSAGLSKFASAAVSLQGPSTKEPIPALSKIPELGSSPTPPQPALTLDTNRFQSEKAVTRENDEFYASMTKILINYVQISTIILGASFHWPSFFQSITDVTNNSIPTSKGGFSVDCFLSFFFESGSDVYFAKLTITLLQPFLVWLAIFCVWLVYRKVARKDEGLALSLVKRKGFVFLLIIGFMLQPNIIQSTSEVFDCTNFTQETSPQYFMTHNPQVRCWSKFHILWGFIVAFPNFLLWALILPLSVLAILRKHHDPISVPHFCFIFEGFQTHSYYWEFIILIRKLVVIFLSVFLGPESAPNQALFILLCLLGFTLTHYYKWPYENQILNRVELLGLAGLSMIMISSLLFLSEPSLPTQIIATVVTIALNFSFFGYALWFLSQSLIIKLHRLSTITISWIRSRCKLFLSTQASASVSAPPSGRKPLKLTTRPEFLSSMDNQSSRLPSPEAQPSSSLSMSNSAFPFKDVSFSPKASF